ncbi:hypothetical protein QOZ80_7BG0602040 [Eleusine coracana subsp. coracana]|nr:hypothetical protein QOZ80_7BG0602040 [Eleusine coracana subsp. coracana]
MLVLGTSSVVGSTAAPPPSGLRLELTHVDSKGNFTKSELFRRAAHRSRFRAATLSGARHGTGYNSATSPTWDTRSKVHWSDNEYVFELAIGTPPVPFVALADTGSDLIWTQSRPCTRCADQSTPIYNPFTSRSFSLEPCASTMCQGTPRFPKRWACSSNGTRPQLCRYLYIYGDGAYSRGVMGRDTLTFPGSRPGTFVSVGGVAFGCGNENTGAMFNGTGTVGLGRGPLSLVAQLGFGKFSYCLTNYFHTKLTSPLLFGSLADLTAGGRGSAAVQTTPLVQNPEHATFYYVSLEGISIGDTRLSIPDHVFDIKSDGSGGVIFDSGSSLTDLHETAFTAVASYVDEMFELPPSNYSTLTGPCYTLQPGVELPEMPDMVLHFADGADMRLHRDNYMMHLKDQSEMCLTINGNRGMSIIGNFQQQNMHVLYDITEGYLSFVPADCTKL